MFHIRKIAFRLEENLYQKKSTLMPPRNRDRDLDHQIDVLNNLNLEKTETKFYLQENGNAKGTDMSMVLIVTLLSMFDLKTLSLYT